MPARLELAGQRFGYLTVIERSHQDRWRAWIWKCQCDCAAVVFVLGATLKAGNTSSCQPCAVQRIAAKNTTHGHARTPLYQRWRSMLGRTGNPNDPAYHNYGGRGIDVCPEWHQFEAFLRDMGPTFKPELTLDRIDVNRGYSPDNCRWITLQEQQFNKRTNHTVTWRGETKTVTEWAAEIGINANTLIYRLRRGWPTQRAMTTPSQRRAS